MSARGIIKYKKSPKRVSKEFKKTLKVELQNTALEWWLQFLPKHFRPGAAQRYGIGGRTAQYQRRKKKQVGHNRPLVFTGKLALQMRTNNKISGTSKGATVKMRKPLAFGRQLENGKFASISRYPKPEFDKEITKVIASEVRHLSRDHKKRITVKLGRVRESTTINF